MAFALYSIVLRLTIHQLLINSTGNTGGLIVTTFACGMPVVQIAGWLPAATASAAVGAWLRKCVIAQTQRSDMA